MDIVIRKSTPASAEAASRRQVAPLCQRGVIPPFGKGRLGGILQINVVIINYETANNWREYP